MFSLALPTIKGYYDFCFQYCVPRSKDSSVWHKKWKTQKICWKFVRPKNIARAFSSKFWYGSPPPSRFNTDLLFTVFVNYLESDARVWFYLIGWCLLKDTQLSNQLLLLKRINRSRNLSKLRIRNDLCGTPKCSLPWELGSRWEGTEFTPKWDVGRLKKLAFQGASNFTLKLEEPTL